MVPGYIGADDGRRTQMALLDLEASPQVKSERYMEPCEQIDGTKFRRNSQQEMTTQFFVNYK